VVGECTTPPKLILVICATFQGEVCTTQNLIKWH